MVSLSDSGLTARRLAFGLLLLTLGCESSNGGAPNTNTGGSSYLDGAGGHTDPSAGGTAPGSGGAAPGSGGATVTAQGGSGTTGRGGAGAGGAPGAGGVPPSDPNVCDDTADFSTTINSQFGSAAFSATNEPSRFYGALANWWGNYSGQTVAVNGLSFTVQNPNNVSASGNDPIGYPSLFIGKYQRLNIPGSNLPKSVSSLTSSNSIMIPTVFETNALNVNHSDFNAAYDVWFTANSSPLSDSASSPGTGGAYLMVWMYDPSNRQPRGSRVTTATVAGSSWDVWMDYSNPACVSYVATSERSSLDADLNAFIKHAVNNNYGVTNSMYLSVIFGGLEVWSGASGAAVTNFCVKVN